MHTLICSNYTSDPRRSNLWIQYVCDLLARDITNCSRNLQMWIKSASPWGLGRHDGIDGGRGGSRLHGSHLDHGAVARPDRPVPPPIGRRGHRQCVVGLLDSTVLHPSADAAEHAETDPSEIQSSEAHTPTNPAQPASDPDPQRRVLAGGAAPGAGVGGRERSPDAPLTWRRRWEAIAVSVGGGGGGDAGGDSCGRWATVRGSKDTKLAFFTSSLFFCAPVPFEWRIAGFSLTVCFHSRFACFDLI